MGIALKGDFIGFWIDDIHSSELGIIRTSDGSRFNENLLPTIQDKTVQVPGGDGFYYFGSYYTQRPFNISIAFDNMSEAQFRRLKQIIGSKKMAKLVFDETPYKYYNVKSTGSPTLKYICFDIEDDTSGGSVGDVYAQTSTAATKRVYKGEGTLSFVAYDPYGYARALSLAELRLPKEMSTEKQERFSELYDFTNNKFLNENEWLFEITDDTGTYQYPLPDFQQESAFVSGSEIQLEVFYNSGDLPCDYKIFCAANDGDTSIFISNYQFTKADDFTSLKTDIMLKLDIPKEETIRKFCFDSKTNCVFGCNDSNEIDYNKIYNNYLTVSKFGKMPVGGQSLWVLNTDGAPTVLANFKYF